MKNYKLFLDDNRNPYDIFYKTIDPLYEKNSDWTIARSYEEFVNTITEKGVPSVISFDHDLSHDHYKQENQEGKINYDSMEFKTGYHCAQWLVENYGKNITFKVHSANPQGSDNIRSLFSNPSI